MTLERADRAELDSEDMATGPAYEDFRRDGRTKGLAKKKENLEGIMAKSGNTPFAPPAAWALAINQADAGVPREEMRA